MLLSKLKPKFKICLGLVIGNRLLQHTGNLLKLHRRSFTLPTATLTTGSSSGDWQLHPLLSFSPTPNFVKLPPRGSDNVQSKQE